MIFPGRMLASEGGITIWQKYQGEGYHLHLVARGVVLDLSPDELAALAQVAPAALAAVAAPEDAKDHARRLQILQARVNDYLKRERAPRSGEDSGTTMS